MKRDRAIASLLTIAAASLAAVAGGCSIFGQNKPQPDQPIQDPLPTTPPPTAAAIAERHNARVAGLSRLWARTHVRLRGTDAQGGAFDETTEGYLMVELPRKLSLSVTKLGEAYFVLGSNPEQFWWLDLSTNPRTARVGSHTVTTRDSVRDFGLPVRPEDLVEILAITPLTLAPDTATRWVTPRDVEIVLPMRDGTRAMRFDARSFEPTAVELRDAAGAVVVSALLSEFDVTGVEGGMTEGPRFQKRTDITVPQIQGVGKSGSPVRVTIDLYGIENKSINPANFNFEALKSRYRVTVVYSLDPRPVQPTEAPR